jgi:hypothetical protein
MGTGGPISGAKGRSGRDADHSPPSSAEVENEWELNILSPCFSIGVLWDCFAFTFICSLFNDAVSSWDYKAYNEKMIDRWRIGKDVEGSIPSFAWWD